MTPVLDTPRLRLRGHTLSDFEACHALWSDPVVVAHITGRPSTREETWARLLRYVGHWQLLGYGFWALEERTSGKLIGEVGLADFHREMSPSFDDTPEMGWVLMPSSHGQGFASEAIRAALAWADQTLEAPKVVCMIAPKNHASIRVAERTGFVSNGTASYRGEPARLFTRARPV